MIRDFFIDCVVGFALCMVVWGSAPALGFWCLCDDVGEPICRTSEIVAGNNGQLQALCSHDGQCGTLTSHVWGWWGPVPWLYPVVTPCACAPFGSGDSPRCQCRPAEQS